MVVEDRRRSSFALSESNLWSWRAPRSIRAFFIRSDPAFMLSCCSADILKSMMSERISQKWHWRTHFDITALVLNRKRNSLKECFNKLEKLVETHISCTTSTIEDRRVDLLPFNEALCVTTTVQNMEGMLLLRNSIPKMGLMKICRLVNASLNLKWRALSLEAGSVETALLTNPSSKALM